MEKIIGIPSAAAARATATSASRCAISRTPIGQRANGVDMRRAEDLDARVPPRDVAQHARDDPPALEGGAVLADRLLRAGSARDVRVPLRRHRLPRAPLEALVGDGDARVGAACAPDVDLELPLPPDAGRRAVAGRLGHGCTLTAHARESGSVSSEPVSYPAPKRVLDKSVAAVLTVLLAPVFAVALGAMGVDMLRERRNRGPLLYRERRISRGREFDLLKFRTLRCDVLERVRDEESHARLFEADESNLTWAGRRVLKPWYLDELPQLFNVLRGDMSLVGPEAVAPVHGREPGRAGARLPE